MARRRARATVVAALGVVLVGALALPASAARDDLDLVSRATSGAAADGASASPSLSADGRLVAFASDADNLASPQLSGTRDVFVRDLGVGTTTLVSRAGPPAAVPGDSISFEPSISADGGRVAFTSEASNLSDLDGIYADVFVRDLRAGTTALASRADGPAGSGADGVSNQPAISADGRHVAFVSDADGLAPGAVPGVASVFVRDLALGTTTLASRAPNGDGADGGSSAPSISRDGRLVAFLSTAENLSSEDTAAQDVFVRDLVAGTTTLVSRATGATGAPAGGLSLSPSISADGTRVAFATSSLNLSDEDADVAVDVFVRDLAAATTTLASRADGPTGAPGDAGSGEPALSADGRHVAFRSTASNLSGADLDPIGDVFVRDLVAGTTTLVSRVAGPTGAAAAAASTEPAVSGDGRYAAFASGADNLSEVDLNAVANVFRRDVLGPPGPSPPPAAAIAAEQVVARSARPARRARCAGRLATIVGTSRTDVIRGTAGQDVVAALGGDDVVLGAAGSDLICLGAGADQGHGGRGADLVRGGPGWDLLLGGAGADLLIGAGRDAARGGAGSDLCRAALRRSC
jgi:Tol biopolymer transport system component